MIGSIVEGLLPFGKGLLVSVLVLGGAVGLSWLLVQTISRKD